MRRRNYFIIAAVVIILIGIIFISNSSKPTGNVIEKNVTAIANITAVENTTANSTVPEYKPYKVRLYLSDQVLANESTLPKNPDKINQLTLGAIASSNGKQYYGPFTLYTYLDGAYNEDISCRIEEYYDNTLSDRFSAEFITGQKTHLTNIIGYEVQGTPDKVRYDITCTGFESRIEWKDSYTFGLVKP